MLFTIDSVYDDIEDKHVGDFGCGGGTLGLGCAILGAGSVLGIDVDPKSLELARQNAADMDLEEETDFILADVAALAAHDLGERWGEAARATGVDENPSGAADVQPEPEPEPHAVQAFLKSALAEVVEHRSANPMVEMAALCRARAANFSAADRAEYTRYVRQGTVRHTSSLTN
jgi:SAM-dependent methyltransferase